MKRSEFIKNLGLGASSLILPKDSNGILLHKSPVKVYNNYVKGLVHYDFKKVRKQLKIGTSLLLKRDISNLYDSFAIQVYFEQYKLGYLPAYENIVLANMLDNGVALNVKVGYLDLSDKNIYEALSIEVYADLIISNKALVEKELLDKPASNANDYYRTGGFYKS